MIGYVLFLVILMLILMVGNVYLSWMIPTDKCPPCPNLSMPKDPCSQLQSKNDNLETMVRYLTLIVKKYEAEQELYRLSNGYHQVYNSPKMEYLRKEIRRMIEEIKADQSKATFFQKNLNGIIE